MSQSSLRLVESSSMDKEKTKALDAALSQIERAFGKGSIMRLGKGQQPVEIETISTGSLGLDIALGVGGLPRGRIIEIYGPESSGKTTLALHTIAEAQKKGGVCAFVDAEHALDPVYARKLGVNLDDLLISQPDTGEQALEIADTLVRSGAIDVLVIDSVAALTPKAELDGEMGDVQPGLQARLMSQALRKLTGSISRSKTMVIFINQIRMKIGVMYGKPGDDHGRQRAEVLRLRAPRHPPRLDPQGPRRSDRQLGAREGRQEQGRAALQAGRVRHHVRRGRVQGGRAHRSRRQGRHRREVRRLVLLRQPAPRPGPRELEAVPARQPGGRATRSRVSSARMPACSPTASWSRRPRPPTTSTRVPQMKFCSPSRAKRGRRERSRRSFRFPSASGARSGIARRWRSATIPDRFAGRGLDDTPPRQRGRGRLKPATFIPFRALKSPYRKFENP